MARKYLCLLVLAASIAVRTSPSEAKDVFQLNGKAKKDDKVFLVIDISDDKDGKGFIREAANYGKGRNQIPNAVPCGQSTRWFEVWSRRNVGKLPEGAPGLRTGILKAQFTLDGATEADKLPVDRQIKGTLKEQSHFKGEDFGIQINLTCQ